MKRPPGKSLQVIYSAPKYEASSKTIHSNIRNFPTFRREVASLWRTVFSCCHTTPCILRWLPASR